MLNLPLFNFDALSLLMICLVGFIGLVVGSFSLRYMAGDRKKKAFFVQLALLISSISILVSADFMPLLVLAWWVSNLLLCRIMLHKSEWAAAKASAHLALKNFTLGAIALASAVAILGWSSGTWQISALKFSSIPTMAMAFSGVLILIAALSQSAIWPFHRWLLSSLNSPTPVSALMHAGLVNGGGFLIARFAFVFLEQAWLMQWVFILGSITALLGTCWKLMQHDVKRMLACSTMGQMGFMLAECGLGLFAAAISHLIWHGMFKAYLFLNSGSAATEKRVLLNTHPSKLHFLIAICLGGLGAISFAYVSQRPLLPHDTSLFIHVLAWVACTQGALSVLQSQFRFNLLLAAAVSVLIAMIYAGNLSLIEYLLEPMQILVPQSMVAIHWIVLGLLLIVWLLMFLRYMLPEQSYVPGWRLRLYVSMLNASQPSAKTVTAHRNHYQY